MEEPFPDLSISFTDSSKRPRSARAQKRKGTTCSVGGCDSSCYSRKLCRSHYNRMWKYGRTAPFRKTKQKKEEPQAPSERLQLLKDRHKVLMARREKERRQNEYLSRGLDEFENAWGKCESVSPHHEPPA